MRESSHTIKVGRPGTPERRLAHKAEYIDADTARNLRWTYRYMRRCGVNRSTAHMLVHSAWSSGVVTGYRAGVQWGADSTETVRNLRGAA